MDILWQEKCILGWSVTISILTLAVPVPTNLPDDQIQHTDSEATKPCGNVCEYEEWFSRAHCDDRGLTYVPSCTGCEGATLLELQENSIQSIPPERIAEYYHVKTLDISWNQISHLDPGTFFSLNHLKNIICSHNRLEIVPDGVLTGTEESLIRIYLNNNNIHTLGEKAFKNLSHLMAIYLNNNHLRSLPQKIFSDIIKVKYLILSDNELNYLENDLFKGLTKLEYLSLDANNLQVIPEGLFTGLESLKEVLLSHNQLITIPDPQNLGLHVNNLERFDLRNNRLNQSVEIIPYLINATWTVDLNDNTFLCDCSFQSIQDWYNTAPNPQTILKCAFANVTEYSINDYLPISCSDIKKVNNAVHNYTTVLTTASHRGNDSLVTLNPYSNVSFPELQTNKNVAQDKEGQLTTVVASCTWITTATLVVSVLFFSLWIGKSVWYGVHDIKRQRMEKRRVYHPVHM